MTVTAADDLALLKDLLITDALPQEGNRARLMRIVDDPSLTFRTAYWPWSTQPNAGYPYPEPVPIRPVEASEKGNTASGLLTEIGRTSHSVVVFVPWTETNPAPHYSVRDVSYPSTDIPNTDVCLDASMESTKTMADVCNRVQVRWFSDDGVTERWLTNTNLSTEWPNPVGSKDIETGCLQLEAAGHRRPTPTYR